MKKTVIVVNFYHNGKYCEAKIETKLDRVFVCKANVGELGKGKDLSLDKEVLQSIIKALENKRG